VDAKTEKQIISNLNEYLNDRTAIIITHRVFSLFDFDRIVVLEDGEIVEQGRHQDLLDKRDFMPLYMPGNRLWKKKSETRQLLLKMKSPDIRPVLNLDQSLLAVSKTSIYL
jgi:energy-coupling factor transporter ATP-binding protein EcfA2